VIAARFVAALLAVAAALLAAPAVADETQGACVPIAVAVCPSIAIGEFAVDSYHPGPGVVVSASVPHVPVPYIPQVAIALPFNGSGRYAATAELRTYGSLYGGLGAGVGNLDGLGEAGFTFTAFAGLKIVSNVSLIARYYLGGKSGAGNSGFFGLRFGF
jgi:hypothetical protein